ncbi:MAG: hypothetical protein U0Y68_13450 [Blastocatellia bacterium]
MSNELAAFTIEFVVKRECLTEVSHEGAWLDLYLNNIGQGVALGIKIDPFLTNQIHSTKADREADSQGIIYFQEIGYLRPGERERLTYHSKGKPNGGEDVNDDEDYMFLMQRGISEDGEIFLQINFEDTQGNNHKQLLRLNKGGCTPQGVRSR